LAKDNDKGNGNDKGQSQSERCELFPEGNEDSDGWGRAQGREPRDWRFVADDVRWASSRSMDRPLSVQEERFVEAWAKDALPVRIARSALAPEVPHFDLHVTAGHSLLIDGVLVPPEALINGIDHHPL
jgi:hypothetical protein